MSDDVTAYISAQPEPQRGTLTAMRATIGAVLPRADECLAYGMPSWRHQRHGPCSSPSFTLPFALSPPSA